MGLGANKFYVTDQNLLKFPNAYWISKNNLRKTNMDLSNGGICILCLIVRASGPEMGLFVMSRNGYVRLNKRERKRHWKVDLSPSVPCIVSVCKYLNLVHKSSRKRERRKVRGKSTGSRGAECQGPCKSSFRAVERKEDRCWVSGVQQSRDCREAIQSSALQPSIQILSSIR